MCHGTFKVLGEGARNEGSAGPAGVVFLCLVSKVYEKPTFSTTRFPPFLPVLGPDSWRVALVSSEDSETTVGFAGGELLHSVSKILNVGYSALCRAAVCNANS